MNGWVLAIGLALASFGLVAFVLKVPRKGWEPVGAALLFGIAGYAWQANPAQPGAPKSAADRNANGTALVEARQALSGKLPGTRANLLVLADGFTRRGQFADATVILRRAVAQNPRDDEAWLALANALVSHADGYLSPAAMLAYRKSLELAPGQPGAPFFFGLALANNGRLVEARAVWAKLLADSPADALWREDLAARLQALDAFIAESAARSPR